MHISTACLNKLGSEVVNMRIEKQQNTKESSKKGSFFNKFLVCVIIILSVVLYQSWFSRSQTPVLEVFQNLTSGQEGEETLWEKIGAFLPSKEEFTAFFSPKKEDASEAVPKDEVLLSEQEIEAEDVESVNSYKEFEAFAATPLSSPLFELDPVYVKELDYKLLQSNDAEQLDTTVDPPVPQNAGATPTFQTQSALKGRISSDFGYRGDNDSEFHHGVDIAAKTGTAINAIATGTVVEVSNNSIYGNYIVLQHQDGYTSKYAHCSKIYKNVGDNVNMGDKIAAVGSTGRSSGPHLHLEIKQYGIIQNPHNIVKIT